eukprot:4419638-Prymnesium_polylepis.1
MPAVKKCPFDTVTVEGVQLHVGKTNGVRLKDMPSGATGVYFWNIGESQPDFETRIHRLIAKKTDSAVTQQPYRELASLTSGHATSNVTPASSPAGRRTSGSKRLTLSPDSAATAGQPELSKRQTRSEATDRADSMDTTIGPRPVTMGSSGSSMDTDAAPAGERALRKCKRELKEIDWLLAQKESRTLSSDELARVERRATVQLTLNMLQTAPTKAATPEATTPQPGKPQTTTPRP